jgi:hypothetical protein
LLRREFEGGLPKEVEGGAGGRQQQNTFTYSLLTNIYAKKNAARTLYGRADGVDEYSTVLSPEKEDGRAASSSREDQSAASDTRGMGETPDEDRYERDAHGND